METKITKVHRAGVTYYAATVSGVYVERRTLEELRTAIAVRGNLGKIFAKCVDAAS
jgi:hypothetical protein